MKSNLFTVLLDYRGGNYIAQVTARTVSGALAAWARRLPSQGVPGIGLANAAALANDLRGGAASAAERALEHVVRRSHGPR